MSWIEMSPTDVGNSIFSEKPLSKTKHNFKIASIETAYKLNDLELLQTLAKSRQGLVRNDLRRKIWPILLGLDKHANGNTTDDLGKMNDTHIHTHFLDHDDIDDFNSDINSISDIGIDIAPSISPPCKDKEQVKLDVERSFVFYPRNPPKQLQSRLLEIICTVLGENPDLSYFQGYHDVAQVVLLVNENEYDYKPNSSSQVLEAISLEMLRDFMTPGLSPALIHLDFIPIILTLEDAYLGELVRNNPPYYALSAVLTLFSHHVRSFDEICVVFDYIIASRNMAMPIYMYVALIISQKNTLKESDSDPDTIHSILSNIADDFRGDLFEQVLKPASKLAEKYPLSAFKEVYGKLSKHSVIKTLSESNSVLFSKADLQSTLHDQVVECQEQMREEKEKRDEERRLKKESAIVVKKTQTSPPSTLLLGKMMVIPIGNRKLMIPKSILGLSICIGVLGVIASSYKYDIQFSWYRFFTQG